MATDFPHRTNPDGTIDSICPRCYGTVGNAHWEADLERMESDHICDPEQLIFFEESRRRRGVKLLPVSETSQRIGPIKRVR